MGAGTPCSAGQERARMARAVWLSFLAAWVKRRAELGSRNKPLSRIPDHLSVLHKRGTGPVPVSKCLISQRTSLGKAKFALFLLDQCGAGGMLGKLSNSKQSHVVTWCLHVFCEVVSSVL